MQEKTTKLCWSFCDDNCALRKYDLCPKEIPPYRSPPPNDGCTSISELRFGKRDYEDMEIEYWREISLLKKRGKLTSSVPHWRTKLSGIDSYAMMYIYTDPLFCVGTKQSSIGTENLKYSRDYTFPAIHMPAWNPNLFQDVLLEDLETLEIIMNSAGSLNPPNLTRLTRKVYSMFVNVFIPKFKQEMTVIIENTKIPITKRKEAEFVLDRLDYNIAFFKDRSPLIIAKFLLELHFTVPEFWMARVAEMNVEEVDLPDNYSKTGSSFILGTGGEEDRVKHKPRSSSSLSDIEFG
jgi:hypothetical protein